ncbi:MAG: hypothetical protein GXP51_10110 [Deltaproteobacteria bacterium]|nr:hypothetical protein [Deltaproteobacteria bacterium]
MHDGCSGSFGDGSQVVDKLRMMGFSQYALPEPVELDCEGCQSSFVMATLEAECPDCGMVYGVTPCHAADRASIKAAGIRY